ncbi:MAG: hypothetical protein KF773_43020 [Deltaproteobacteria bacterium]|nr:hypothetical protein [Deltaproteobacteria bacterium]MCW5806639.1 hypothetical protein [Deltaproteobacteria bacterium]
MWRRWVASTVLDGAAVLVLAAPAVCAYLRWPMLALYALVSGAFVMMWRRNPWIYQIASDPLTRIAHGLEHATIAVLEEDRLPVAHGFTHGTNRFMVALEGDHAHRTAEIADAAARAIRRIRAGERALAYHRGCGTSSVVAAATLWLAFATSAFGAVLLGGTAPIFYAISLVAVRMWIAWREPLGLLAQRLYTVSTDFGSAEPVAVRALARVGGWEAPSDETWFEVLVRVEPRASAGGAVAPGVEM